MNCSLLYLVGQLRAGGLERQLSYLLQAIDRNRYSPAVAIWNCHEDDFYAARLREMSVPLHFAPPTSGPLKLSWFRSLVKQLRPEVVHSYSFHTNFAAWYAAAANGAVAVGSVRSDFDWAKRQVGPYVGRLSARWPRTQIFNSFTAAKTARKSRSPFKPSQVFVVRNGIDLERFTKTPLPNDSHANVIGIGSLTAVKRWDRVLRAACQLQRNGLRFLARIVGDGPLHESLQRQAHDLKIRDCIEFLEQRNDIPALISSATFLVLTSESEGCPNVVMEAMAAGRAVVSTDAGDVPALIEDGKTGFVVRQGDDNALIERMGTLINNPALCRRMGEAARARAEAEFGLERLMRETFAAYRRAGWLERSTAIVRDQRSSPDQIATQERTNG